MHSDVDPPDDRPTVATPTGVGEGALLGDRYRLGALIGRGGTAEVYRGRDELLDRDVAVKLFDLVLTDLNSVDRQRGEMRALAALSDPHLVAVHDARLVEPGPGGPSGAVPDHSYLVMELVDGGTLAERLHDEPLGADELAPIAIAVASGLAVAHAEGLIHRDIKPANVLIASSGAVKLGDFGLARVVATDSTLTSGSMLIGTAAYFSPEQAAGEVVGPPADIYALGLVLLEALTGRREFPGAPMPSAMARLLRDPEIPGGLPAPWPALLLRMTDRDPTARPTAAEVVRILTAADSAATRVVADTVAAPRPVPLPVLLPGGADDQRAPVTAAGPSILSAFLRPEGDVARKARRRNSVLAGAGVLVAAVMLTAVITVSGEPSPPADASPVAVRSEGSVVATSESAVGTTAAPSSSARQSAAIPRTTPVTTSAIAVRAPAPVSSTSRTSNQASTAASRAAASRASASRAAASRAAAARAAARAAAERAAAVAAADKAAVRAAAERAAADRQAQQDAQQAAEAARKAAEKQQKQADKDVPGPGNSGKPGKKP